MATKPRAAQTEGLTDPLRAERRPLHQSGALFVLASLLWPVQAGAIAWLVARWVQGGATLRDAVIGAGVTLVIGIIRAGLRARAQGIAFDAANRVIGAARDALLARETHIRSDVASASVAALVAEKLPLLGPWIIRYRPAILRVMVVCPVILVLIAWHSWAAGAVLLLAGPLVPVFMAIVGIAAGRAAKAQMIEVSAMNDLAMERLSALLDLRLIGAADRSVTDFETRADGLRRRTMAVLRVAFLSSTLLELLAGLGIALIAVYVGLSLTGVIGWGQWGQPLSVGRGMFILLLVPEFFQPLRDMAGAWHDRAAGQAVLAELTELHARAVGDQMVGQGAAAAPLPGPLSVEVSGVQTLRDGTTLRLPDVTLGAADSVALTGPSGAGKSTLLSLIAGLSTPSAGQITVCGVPLSGETADAWRARLAFVPQRPHFAGRALGAWLDPRGSGRDPWPALERAGAHHIVEALPDGLDTILGETGGGVSGGEARRLLMARAILTGADLLIADEPTADLDPQTAARMIDMLAQLKAEGHSLLIATHDPALAARMDRVIEVRSA